MVSKESLLDLIRSMNTQEAKYFRHSLRAGGEENQLLLMFDEMWKMLKSPRTERVPDPDAVLTLKLRAQIRQYATVRSNLCDRLLAALYARLQRTPTTPSTEEGRIRAVLHGARVLELRGLFEAALSEYNRGLLRAQRYEYHQLCVEALGRMLYLESQQSFNGYSARLQRLAGEMEQHAGHYRNEMALKGLHYQAFVLPRTRGGVIDDVTRDEILRLRAHPLLADELRPATFLSRIYYHFTRSLLASFDSLAETMYHSKQIMRTWEACSNPDMVVEHQDMYIIHLSNHLNYAIRLQDFDEYRRWEPQLAAQQPASFDHQAELFQNLNFCRLLYHLNIRDFRGACALVPEIHQGLVRYEAKINRARLMAFHYNIVLAYFFSERYATALDECEKMLALGRSEHRGDLVSIVRLLRIVLHYELRHHDQLDRLTRNMRTFLAERQRPTDWESLVLTHLIKLIDVQMVWSKSDSAEERAQKLELYRAFLEAIQTFKNTYPSPTLNGYQEFFYWISKKLEEQE